MIDPTQVVTSGSLLVFAGAVSATLLTHDKRLDNQSKHLDLLQREVSDARTDIKAIAVKEGIQL